MADDINRMSGWHWYNEKSDKKEKKPRETLYLAFKSLSATEQLKILQQATEELRAKAVLSGKVSDITRYKQAQDMWVDKASAFTVGWERMLLAHPELNYSLRYPNQNRLAPVVQQERHAQEQAAIHKLAKRYSLILFYQGKNQSDQLLAPMIQQFAEANHWALLAVSVDGKSASVFKNTGRFDRGHIKANALGVRYFPALLLVDPKNSFHQVISYGFVSINELSERILNIVNGWKPNF